MTKRPMVCTRASQIAALAALTLASACARQQRYNVMFAPAACDTIPSPVSEGERVGATLPSVERSGSDSGVVVGTVLEAGTGRALGGASVTLHAPFASLSEITPIIAGTPTNSLGGFVVRTRAPGPYTLAVRRIGYRPSIRSIALRAGAIDTVHLELHYWHCIGY